MLARRVSRHCGVEHHCPPSVCPTMVPALASATLQMSPNTAGTRQSHIAKRQVATMLTSDPCCHGQFDRCGQSIGCCEGDWRRPDEKLPTLISQSLQKMHHRIEQNRMHARMSLCVRVCTCESICNFCVHPYLCQCLYARLGPSTRLGLALSLCECLCLF